MNRFGRYWGLNGAVVLGSVIAGCTQPKSAESPAAPDVAASAAPLRSVSTAVSPLSRTSSAPTSAVSSLTNSAERSASKSKAPDAVDLAVAAQDRSAADVALDSGRHPAQLFKFFGIAPGMRVAELAAGGGYTAELLARVVGPSGAVYGQNSPFILQRFAQAPWTERLKKAVNANILRVDREFDAPLPPDVKDLDAVLFVLFYHDTVWLKTDRAKMNQAIFAALKPGGVYGVVDHSAKPGQGLTQVETLHRIEESILVHEIEAAGFIAEARGNFLANPADARDWNASPRVAAELRGTSDRFVYRFVKPATAK